MNEIKQLARDIVRKGEFVPSVEWEPSDHGGTYRGKWVPVWTESLLQRLRVRELDRNHRDAVALYVDKLVRDRISPELKHSAFQALKPRYGVPHTPLEKWISGLLEDEGQEVTDWFAEDVLEYYRSLTQRLETASFRLALVLLEPDDREGPWLLVPGLQPIDEPAAFVPASAVWSAVEPDPIFGGRRYPDAQGRMDQALAQAAERWEILANIQPESPWVKITEEEAVEFLQNAPSFETDGIHAVVPSWWNASAPLEASISYAAVEPMRAPAAAKGIDGVDRPSLGFAALLSFRKELLLNGKPISETEWRHVSERSSQVMFYGGRWSRLRNRDRMAVERFFQSGLSGTVRAGEALQTVLQIEGYGEAYGAFDDDSPIPLRNWSGGGWLAKTVSALKSVPGEETLDAPASFQGELREYQQRGFSWLVRMRQLGFGACLADDMGLGKTIQWIAYALYVREQSSEPKLPFLLLCPTSVLGNWQRELKRFAPSLSAYLHYGPNRLQDAAFLDHAKSCDIVLTSYTTAQRDSSLIRRILWDTVTLDEAQFMKNPQTKLAQMIYSLEGRHRIAMTGTPLENRLSDLWSLFAFLNPGYLGSERQFRRRFEHRGDDAALQRLSRLIQPFLLRRMKSDEKIIADLPEKTERTEYCGLTERQADLYEAVLRRMEEQLTAAVGMKRRGIILAAITKLKQICNAPEHALRQERLEPGGSGKLMRLEQLLEPSLIQQGRSIIFTQYAYMAKLLQAYLAERFQCKVGLIIGQTPRKEREETVRSFQEAPDGPKILVMTLKTGGFGINLTRANQLIHYDRWWNPAAEQQATDRAYRIGQMRHVAVWKLVTKGTLEEAIEQLLARKEKLAKEVVGKGETWITEYSDEELKELLALRGWDADDETLRTDR